MRFQGKYAKGKAFRDEYPVLIFLQPLFGQMVAESYENIAVLRKKQSTEACFIIIIIIK